MFGSLPPPPSLLLLFVVEIVTHFGHRTAGKQASSSNQKHFARNGPCVTIMMLNAKIIVLLNNHRVFTTAQRAHQSRHSSGKWRKRQPEAPSPTSENQMEMMLAHQPASQSTQPHTKSIDSR